VKTLKNLALFGLLALVGCATDYQPQSFTGGYTDYLTAPDAAVVTFRGNGYTDPMRLGEMAALRCAEVALTHGFRYFVLTNAVDLSRTSSFNTPGYANTYGIAYTVGNFVSGNATTTITPPQTYRFYKPGIMMSIQMSNGEKSLQSLGMFINGQNVRPKDAAFLSQSLRQVLGIRNE
jgi:hypothetical protein